MFMDEDFSSDLVCLSSVHLPCPSKVGKTSGSRLLCGKGEDQHSSISMGQMTV